MPNFFRGFITGAAQQATANINEANKADQQKDMYYTKMYTETQAELAKAAAANEESARKLRGQIPTLRNSYGLPDDDTTITLMGQAMNDKGEVDMKRFSEIATRYKAGKDRVENTGATNPSYGAAPVPAQPNETAMKMFPDQWWKKNKFDREAFGRSYSSAFAKPQLPATPNVMQFTPGKTLEEEKFAADELWRKTQADRQILVDEETRRHNRRTEELTDKQRELTKETNIRLLSTQRQMLYDKLAARVEKGLSEDAAKKMYRAEFPDAPEPDFSTAVKGAKINDQLKLVNFAFNNLTDPAAREEFYKKNGGGLVGIDWAADPKDPTVMQRNAELFSKTYNVPFPEALSMLGGQVDQSGRVISRFTGSDVGGTGPGPETIRLGQTQINQLVEENRQLGKLGPILQGYMGTLKNSPEFLNVQQKFAQIQNYADAFNLARATEVLKSITMDPATAQMFQTQTAVLLPMLRAISVDTSSDRFSKEDRMLAEKALGLYEGAGNNETRLIAAGIISNVTDRFLYKNVTTLGGQFPKSQYAIPKYTESKQIDARTNFLISQGMTVEGAKAVVDKELRDQGL